MQLLNDQRIDSEDGEVKLTIKPLTTSQQARLDDLARVDGTAGRMELAIYGLKNLVEKISVSGESFDPVKLANYANLSDKDTSAVMGKIGAMIYYAAYPKVEDLKK